LNFLNEQAIEYGFIQKEETPPPPNQDKAFGFIFQIHNKLVYENITDLLNSLKKNPLLIKRQPLPISEVYFQQKKLSKKSSGQAIFQN
jgi:hypothetical protein